MILAYGGPTAALWCIGAAAVIAIVLLVRKFLLDRADEKPASGKKSGKIVASSTRRSGN
jgi:hypothetical protein